MRSTVIIGLSHFFSVDGSSVAGGGGGDFGSSSAITGVLLMTKLGSSGEPGAGGGKGRSLSTLSESGERLVDLGFNAAGGAGGDLGVSSIFGSSSSVKDDIDTEFTLLSSLRVLGMPLLLLFLTEFGFRAAGGGVGDFGVKGSGEDDGVIPSVSLSSVDCGDSLLEDAFFGDFGDSLALPPPGGGLRALAGLWPRFLGAPVLKELC